MKKQVIKFYLNNKPDKSIASKPLSQNDNLTSIRNNVKDKIKIPYIFKDKEGKNVLKEEENKKTLQDIIVGDKRDKIIITEDDSIKVYLNEAFVHLLARPKEINANEIREKLIPIIKDFIFFDSDNNEIDLNDEEYYSLENLLIKDKDDNDCIKLKKIEVNNNEIKFFKIYINKKEHELIKLSLTDLLKDVKEKISYKSSNLRFLHNNFKINLEDETTTKLKEILEDADNKIYLSDENSEWEKYNKEQERQVKDGNKKEEEERKRKEEDGNKKEEEERKRKEEEERKRKEEEERKRKEEGICFEKNYNEDLNYFYIQIKTNKSLKIYNSKNENEYFEFRKLQNDIYFFILPIYKEFENNYIKFKIVEIKKIEENQNKEKIFFKENVNNYKYKLIIGESNEIEYEDQEKNIYKTYYQKIKKENNIFNLFNEPEFENDDKNFQFCKELCKFG